MTVTDVEGILVGHADDPENQTGCTAVLCPQGAVGGVFLAGFAPGSRELELLRPETRIEEVHAIMLSGGSAFGLAAADGAMRWLRENGYGLDTIFARVPLVAAAVIYDLFFNNSGGPGPDLGYQAAAAASDGPAAQGCVGAGMGATAGKLLGFERVMKSGVGSSSASIGGITVGAITVANPLGNIVDPDTGQHLAGARGDDGRIITDEVQLLSGFTGLLTSESNTVLSVVATDATLTKVQACRVAKMAAAGMARALRPAHTLFDGDVVFCLATGRKPAADENLVGAVGATVLARSIAAAARESTGRPGFPAYRDLES